MLYPIVLILIVVAAVWLNALWNRQRRRYWEHHQRTSWEAERRSKAFNHPAQRRSGRR